VSAAVTCLLRVASFIEDFQGDWLIESAPPLCLSWNVLQTTGGAGFRIMICSTDAVNELTKDPSLLM
jgi:hypothetical protein